MSRCVDCGKENEGFICAHCLAKRASKIGKGAKKVGGFILAAAPAVITLIVTKGKGNPKA
ncbi:hypothetical protein SAMN05192546_102169 [Tindallia californiensis]|uniref:Uncharacterized protein n=1 Tax=Tindallia californiensis TaxID=159292 RepID=A0A1H3JZE7_9FIRM|nr:hypothetical protein SAMN05192546_102169 [Tindallia californiensis]